MNKDINKFKKAFTLIEVMVSVAIFSLLIAGPTGFFISSLKAQKKALSSQELIDTASYFLEYTSRAIRMAQKDSSSTCLTSLGKRNYELTEEPEQGIKFLNYKGECQKIYLEVSTGRIIEERGGSHDYLTSGNLEVVDFKISLSGETQLDDLQPKVTILLKIKGKSLAEEMNPEMIIQTTLSQRNLDINE